MQNFRYSAFDQDGERLNGEIEAASLSQAGQLLKDKGLIITNLEEKKEFELAQFFSFFRGVPTQEKIVFTRQLATMISSGLPIVSALKILENQARNANFKKALNDIIINIDSGGSLSASIEKHPRIFNNLYRSLIRAGEASGKLDEIMNRLADNMEKDAQFKSKTRGALVYPAVIVVVMFGVLAIMMVFVIPRLADLYEEIGAELPITTKLLLATSSFATNFWWAVILLSIGLILLFRKAVQTTQGRYILDDTTFKFPIIGKLLKETQLTSFTRTLSLLVKSGIPIISALEISQDTLSNIHFKEAVAASIAQIEKGKGLSESLRNFQQFPPILPEMMAVGEQTGKLDEVLEKVSTYFENEATNLANNLATALEPIIMVTLGVVVGFLVISLILPIYSLISQF